MFDIASFEKTISPPTVSWAQLPLRLRHGQDSSRVEPHRLMSHNSTSWSKHFSLLRTWCGLRSPDITTNQQHKMAPVENSSSYGSKQGCSFVPKRWCLKDPKYNRCSPDKQMINLTSIIQHVSRKLSRGETSAMHIFFSLEMFDRVLLWHPAHKDCSEFPSNFRHSEPSKIHQNLA